MQACGGNDMNMAQTDQLKKPLNNQEKISIALDGELSESEFQELLIALESTQGQADWDLFHQIGDILRSDELDIELSSDFSKKMAQRLAAEPYHLLPIPHENKVVLLEPRRWRQRLWSGMAVAAGLLVVVNITHSPNSELSGTNSLARLSASASKGVSTVAASAGSDALVNKPSRTISRQGVEVLRDPEIDQYLAAHQRFSPSVYSAVEYARPTTMKKNGTDK